MHIYRHSYIHSYNVHTTHAFARRIWKRPMTSQGPSKCVRGAGEGGGYWMGHVKVAR